MRDTEYITTSENEARTGNTGLAKVAVQCSADTFVVNQNWFSASTFVVKIATFAKPENVILNQNKMEDAKTPYLMRVLLGTPVYWLYFYP